ncbi:uncharacterized protein LOC121416875 [Lytechinus variegatus]|uniref:uncharacterized protein LOC121416875 n=1 Tax=Lytechinus variegatus TaxID=7654 RepID=UPI001BB1F772|nr:uncharacterized protein LOC121416875 [Lytechinus variegatus]
MSVMEDEQEVDISFPDYGFYSVQDEVSRRYSRTGKHKILAQKYDASLMKYRYSDETEKSSPYDKARSDSESPSPSDSAGSYQGVYSPQLAQRNEEVRDTLWNSSRKPRRSFIEDESTSTWISPGVHPGVTDPFEKDHRHPVAELKTSDQQFVFENAYQSNSWLEDDHHILDKTGTSDEEVRNECTDEDPRVEESYREPPPPYSVAVRSSKVPSSYRDIAPRLSEDLHELPDTGDLMEDLEGSEQDQELTYHNSDLEEPVRPQVDISNQADVSVWAELVQIDESEDENPALHNSSGIITESKERRTSSPDRHIRFVLEAKRAKSDPEDITKTAVGINWMGSEDVQYSNRYETGGVGAYEEHQGGKTGLTPLVDEVFSYPSTSDNAAPTGDTGIYGLDNPSYAYDVEESYRNSTSIDHRRHTTQPLRSDMVHRQAIDWYGKGPVYDSSQSSTLDSVFTERSWSSEVGRPRAFRQKRRVYPKPRDPVGDLGDGLKSKSGRRAKDKDINRLHQSRSFNSPMTGSRGRGHRASKVSEDDLRRSIVKRELELFMQRKTGKDGHPNSRRVGSREKAEPTAASKHNKSVTEPTLLKLYDPQHRTHRHDKAGNHLPTQQAKADPRWVGPNSRTFSDDDIRKTVPLRNSGIGGKKDRPLTYPNDVNRPFSQLISREDNFDILNDLNRINKDRQPLQSQRHTRVPKQPLSSNDRHHSDRGDIVRRHDRGHHPTELRKPRDATGNMSQLPPKPQRQITRGDSQATGHIHPVGKPQLKSYQTRERHLPPSGRTRDGSGRTSGMPATSEFSARAVHPEPIPGNKPANEPARTDLERANPTNEAVPEVSRPEASRADSNNNQPGQKSDSGFSNYRFLSVMAALWFFPIGIWALRKSHQVDSRVKANDLPGARRASKSARNHAIAAFVVLGFIMLILIARLIEITIDPRKTFIQYYKIVPDEVDSI